MATDDTEDKKYKGYKVFDFENAVGNPDTPFKAATFNELSKTQFETDDAATSGSGSSSSSASIPNPLTGITIQLPAGTSSVTALGWQSEPDSGLLRNAADDYSYIINGTSVTEWLSSEFRVNYLTAGQIVFPDSNKKLTGSSSLFWDNTNNTLEFSGNGSSSQPYMTFNPVCNGNTGQFIMKFTPTEASTHNFNLIACEKINPVGARNNVHLKLGYNINSSADKPEVTTDYSMHLAIESYFLPVANPLTEAYFQFFTASATPTFIRPWFCSVDTVALTALVNHSAAQHTWFLSDGSTQLFQMVSTLAQFAIHTQVAMNDALTTPQLDLHQAGSGDAVGTYTLFNSDSFAVGVDNSDANKFKISYNSAGNPVLGTNDRLTIAVGGGVGVNQFLNVGTATDASAQGAFAAGLSAAARIYWDGSGTYNIFSASGTTARCNIQSAGNASADFRIQGPGAGVPFDWLFQGLTANGFFRIFDNAGTSTGERFTIDQTGNVILRGNTGSALSTSATDGFPHAPTCAGAPTGTPTLYTGQAPFVIDTTNGKFWAYYGGAWHFAALT